MTLLQMYRIKILGGYEFSGIFSNETGFLDKNLKKSVIIQRAGLSFLWGIDQITVHSGICSQWTTLLAIKFARNCDMWHGAEMFEG